jgi:hypothetical protein
MDKSHYSLNTFKAKNDRPVSCHRDVRCGFKAADIMGFGSLLKSRSHGKPVCAFFGKAVKALPISSYA